MPRLRYTGPSGAYDAGNGLLFEQDGHSLEVDEDLAERLTVPGEHQFDVLSKDDEKAEDDADAAAQARAEAEAEGAKLIDETQEEAAARRAAFYNAQSEAEIEAAGVADEDAGHAPEPDVQSPDEADFEPIEHDDDPDDDETDDEEEDSDL